MNQLKMISTLVGLLLIFSALVAGVIDTKSQVYVLERDHERLADRVQSQIDRQADQYEAIKDALYELKVGQAVLKQRLDSFK